MASKKLSSKKSPVSKKISKLKREGKGRKQSVATALSMKKSGRLAKSGAYKRVGSKSGRR